VATKTGYHLALFDIKRVTLDNFPFVKAAFTQGLALVLVTGGGFFKGYDIPHNRSIPLLNGRTIIPYLHQLAATGPDQVHVP
jgi:hypothetical protein